MIANATLEVVSNRFLVIADLFEPHVADAMNTAIVNTAAAADPITPVDTGLLRANKTLTFASPGNLEGSITWNQDYAGYVHDGTRHMAARPFARQAVDQITPGYLADLANMGLG